MNSNTVTYEDLYMWVESLFDVLRYRWYIVDFSFTLLDVIYAGAAFMAFAIFIGQIMKLERHLGE